MKFSSTRSSPARLTHHLNEAGHDAIHTLDLPDQNRTTDVEISRVADAEDRIVVSKDADFRDSHLLGGTPARLLVVSTGNITNRSCSPSWTNTSTRLWPPSRARRSVDPRRGLTAPIADTEFLRDDQVDGHDDLLVEAGALEPRFPGAGFVGEDEAGIGHRLTERRDVGEESRVEHNVGVGREGLVALQEDP